MTTFAEQNAQGNASDQDSTSQGHVQIIPLEGTLPTIDLWASALPLKGMEFPGEQRISTRYYVGNPVATQQLGGPTKPPSTWMGHWMDVDLGEGGARALVLQFENLRDLGIPVEVRWGGRNLAAGEDPAVVRRGLIKKFTPKYNRLQDVEWTCEWEWRGETQQTKPPTFASDSFATSNDFSALQDQLVTTQADTESWMDVAWGILGTGANAMLTVSDALDDVQSSIASGINLIDGASDMLSQMASLPSNIADRVRGICARIIIACANGRAALGEFCGLWPGVEGIATGQDITATGAFINQQAGQAKLAMFPHDDPLEHLDGQTAQYDLIRSWDLLAQQAATASATIASQQVPDIIAIVRPAAGTDLRDLAVTYYGNADDWIVIADYNDLDSSEVPATASGPSDDGAPPIYIPRLTSDVALLNDLWGDSGTTTSTSGSGVPSS